MLVFTINRLRIAINMQNRNPENNLFNIYNIVIGYFLFSQNFETNLFNK